MDVGDMYTDLKTWKKKLYSKCFKTIEEAATARKELERLHWGIA